MKLIEYIFVDADKTPSSPGGIDAGYSDRWGANIWYWLTDIPDDTPEGTVFGYTKEAIERDRWSSSYVEIGGVRYLVQCFDGMDMESIMFPVFEDIASRFHAEECGPKPSKEEVEAAMERMKEDLSFTKPVTRDKLTLDELGF
jgi:hypothetical protein